MIKFITFIIFLSFQMATQSQAAVATPPPIVSPASSSVSDAKITLLGKSYAVVFSYKTLMVVRVEDDSKFLDWVRSSGTSTPPPYTIEPTGNSQYPYKIVASFSGEEFLLQQPSPPIRWYLSLGKWHLYTLEEMHTNLLTLHSEDSADTALSYWELENPTNETASDWRDGDALLVIDVVAQSTRGQLAMIGHLIFRFEDKEDALKWLSDRTSVVGGFWAHQANQ